MIKAKAQIMSMQITDNHQVIVELDYNKERTYTLVFPLVEGEDFGFTIGDWVKITLEKSE